MLSRRHGFNIDFNIDFKIDICFICLSAYFFFFFTFYRLF